MFAKHYAMTVKTLGILGGGQLGMYSAAAAKRLGITAIIYCDRANSCAAQSADDTVTAPYDDETALKQFAERCDVITYEFENIPVKTVQFLKQYTPVYPDDNLLDIAQDRIAEKTFLNGIDIQTAPWRAVHDADDLEQAYDTLGTPLIVKTTRFGYDGKGQMRCDDASQVDTVWNALTRGKNSTLIAEACIDFKNEISVVIARDVHGDTVTYGPMLNTHKNHILHETVYPSGLDNAVQAKAIQLSKTLAEHVNLRGVLCLELFVTRDHTLLANEIAPRTHNSGHWSIDGCTHSQFDNHVRAVCGLSVSDPEPQPTRMINLIGDDITKTEQYKNAIVHDYGKGEIKDGRKMGHVNFLN